TIGARARLMLLTAAVVASTFVATWSTTGFASGQAGATPQAAKSSARSIPVASHQSAKSSGRSTPVASYQSATSTAGSTALASQQAATSTAQSTALSQQMPVDPQITMGKFSNGLRYYIRANKKPEKRAELRLVIKAGSILEDDDQQGMAHFAEHMAFNGTRNFPKQDLIKFIESLGMRFGAHLNAYTSFDETVYMLQVPTDKPEVMDQALLILEDWARNVTFDPTEIDKERGVVMEEWRIRRGAGERMLSKIWPIMLKGSRYADRLPIGKPEIIQGGKAERLKKFYTDWYRPDLMAVVAVGDFDKAAIEKLITTHFAQIPAATKPRPRPSYDVPDHPGTRYAIATDKEMEATLVTVNNILPGREEGSVGAYRQKTVDRLFSGMLSARFSELAQTPEAPFIFAGASRRGFLSRTKDEASMIALVKEDGIERGLDALLTEAERVGRFGFTATELDRQKQNVLRNYERNAAEKETRESSRRADEYVRNFLANETLPSAEDEYALHQRFVPQITLDEINQLARQWFPDRNRLIVVRAPEKSGLVVPDETKLAAVIKSASAKELKPYVDSLTASALLDPIPAPGTIAKTTTKEAAGITEWELSNGVKVVLKPTTFKADEIVFRASSPGGTSLAGDKDYIPASTATQVVTAGGLGKFNAIDLRKIMTGKIASAWPYIGELEEGLTGSSSRKDLEMMFQLIYLRFLQPRADPTAFSVQAAQEKSLLANQAAIPEFAFLEALEASRYQNHPRRRYPTAAMVDEWNLDKSLAFYRDRFADASDFTFVFVGSFDLATIKPLVERYLGALPSIRRKESWKDVGARTATGVIEKKVEKGIEPKSLNAIVFSGPFEYDQTQRVAIRAMADVLQTKLLETIREELGGTYSISASASYQRIPNPEYSITIEFGCAPERAGDLIKRVFEEIEKLKANGPTEKEVNDEKGKLLRDFETNSKLNNYLVNQIALRYQSGEDPVGFWNIPEYYKKIDGTMIQQAAKKYLDLHNYLKVTLLPEKK
ncbi:MAG TPA: insulinase family protein, partial [Blastocatellia bacterium]|nr:insulinase family protein [Blastocatellia bacterium]